MKVIHLVLMLGCCVHSSFAVQRKRQPPAAKWKSNAAESTMPTAAPTMTNFSNQARRDREAQAKFNEINITLPPLVNSTQVVYALENEGDGKEYDHKHRVLLAMQSDVKVRDKVKPQGKMKSVSLRNNMPDSRKRLKDGIKDLILKLHPSHLNSYSSVEESEPPSKPSKASRPLANISNTHQRPAHLKMLECEDIPHSEALLHSAFLKDAESAKSKTQKSIGREAATSTAESIEDLPELRKKQLKSRRNQLKMLSAYRGFPPFVWPPNSTPYNRFNIHNPYSYFDCNYFLNPLNEVGVPTIEYIWEDYDDAGGSTIDDLTKKNMNRKE